MTDRIVFTHSSVLGHSADCFADFGVRPDNLIRSPFTNLQGITIFSLRVNMRTMSASAAHGPISMVELIRTLMVQGVTSI